MPMQFVILFMQVLLITNQTLTEDTAEEGIL